MLQSNYWFTSHVNNKDINEDIQSQYHMSFKKAVEFAIKNKCKTVERHKMCKDAIIKLDSGNGGFVEESFVEWENPYL